MCVCVYMVSSICQFIVMSSGYEFEIINDVPFISWNNVIAFANQIKHKHYYVAKIWKINWIGSSFFLSFSLNEKHAWWTVQFWSHSSYMHTYLLCINIIYGIDQENKSFRFLDNVFGISIFEMTFCRIAVNFCGQHYAVALFFSVVLFFPFPCLGLIFTCAFLTFYFNFVVQLCNYHFFGSNECIFFNFVNWIQPYIGMLKNAIISIYNIHIHNTTHTCIVKCHCCKFPNLVLRSNIYCAQRVITVNWTTELFSVSFGCYAIKFQRWDRKPFACWFGYFVSKFNNWQWMADDDGFYAAGKVLNEYFN